MDVLICLQGIEHVASEEVNVSTLKSHWGECVIDLFNIEYPEKIKDMDAIKQEKKNKILEKMYL